MISDESEPRSEQEQLAFADSPYNSQEFQLDDCISGLVVTEITAATLNPTPTRVLLLP